MKKRILIVVLILVVIGIAWYLVSRKNVVNNELVQPNNIELNEITERSIVSGNFRGYYEEMESTAWGERAICKTLIILEGHEGLLKYFKNKVNKGNLVSQITKEGYLQVSLPWDEIPISFQDKIMNSTLEQPVDILLTKNSEYPPRHAYVCHSFFSFDNDNLIEN